MTDGLAALFAVALLWPPAGTRRVLFWTAVVAAIASLPSLVEKLWWAQAASGRDETGIGLCAGCLPRYLADADAPKVADDASGVAALPPELYRELAGLMLI